MNFNVANVFDIAAAALGACSLPAVLMLSISVRRWRMRCAAVESTLADVRRELEVMASICARTDRRVQRMEHEYSGVADRIESVELRGPPQRFDQAIDSARRGADPGRLTQQYGLSRVEADLVTQLHGRKKTA